MSSTVTKSKYIYRSSGGPGAEVNIEYGTDIGALTRLEDKVRLLQEDLEAEREIRQRIEREKADLSVAVIQLQERLEEAEGGAESQFEQNKKRDIELQKLRKLLDDVHLESEEAAQSMRRKHQESIIDLQDQLDLTIKSKAKVEKEKTKMQEEIYELLSQIESATKDKLATQKHCEKLEITVHDLTLRLEEMNRSIIDITSIKMRLVQENLELTKEVQDIKIQFENVSHLKSQLAVSLEETRRRLEEEERRRSTLESTLHSYEVDMESLRNQLDEESEARLDLERQLSKANMDAATWKNKYETEAQARAEEVEELRRKYNVRIQELEENIEQLLAKCAGLEKQKSRLQSEVEVLIIDLEKANSTARELQKRCDHLERLNGDLKSKMDELGALYEQAQRDLRNKQNEITRLTHECDKLKDQNNNLTRENKKLSDELSETRNNLSELTRRYHELEIECRRLENERDELNAAYKEAESARKQEEQRSMRLTAEMAQMRHDFEKQMQHKEEEMEALKKSLTMEIESLSARLVEAETRLKTEVTRIKKKMQAQVTELEMSLDVANKTNINLQQTIKKYSLQLTELQAHYDEVQRQLTITIDQLNVCQRKLTSLGGELDEARSAMEAALRGKRHAEQLYEEATAKINELTTININISSSKAKLEQELQALQGDYDEINKELRLADDRAQKAAAELKHALDSLHEEQERVVKLDAIKKGMEVEIKNLTIRLEEVEANALIGGKRIISKLEARIRDVELEFDEEKRRHAETIKILRKKERQVKEIMIAAEEDHKNATLLQESVDKLSQKVNLYKRQFTEQETLSGQNVNRVRRFQRELEAAEERAEAAESNLSLIRAKHRSFVTAIPGGTATTHIYETERHETY